MAEATHIQAGTAIDHTPGSALAAGEVVHLGTLNNDASGIGVPPNDIAAGVTAGIEIEGIFDIVKAGGTGVAFAEWAAVYWDTALNTAVVASGANTVYAGTAIVAAADADTVVRVNINK